MKSFDLLCDILCADSYDEHRRLVDYIPLDQTANPPPPSPAVNPPPAGPVIP